MSWYSIAPALIFSRVTASPWYGKRNRCASVMDIAVSCSGPVDAPVRTSRRYGLPRSRSSTARFASATGTAFGYPAPVKPLMPTTAPFGISAAAASADITFDFRPLWRIRSDIAMSLLAIVLLHGVELWGMRCLEAREAARVDAESSAGEGAGGSVLNGQTDAEAERFRPRMATAAVRDQAARSGAIPSTISRSASRSRSAGLPPSSETSPCVTIHSIAFSSVAFDTEDRKSVV